MVTIRRLIKIGLIILLATGCANLCFAWNAFGHRLVAQIAYNNLSEHAKQVFNHYNHALDKEYRPQNFVNAASWLDSLRFQDVNWYDHLHYINIPFSWDGTYLTKPPAANVVWAISQAVAVLNNPSSNDFDKGLSLRILIHVLGDIHQPLHAAAQFSKHFPNGDRGGNLLALGKNSVAGNLHGYWDKGAGLLKVKSLRGQKLNKQADFLLAKSPCKPEKNILSPQEWALESHQLAIKVAYTIHYGQKPNKIYQRKVKQIAEERIVLAGCRLAAILNDIDSKIDRKINTQNLPQAFSVSRLRHSIR